MKRAVVLLSLVGTILPGTVQAGYEYWHAPRYRSQRWPAFFVGERQQYDPSTLSISHVEAAPPNNCGPAAFEILNTDRGERPCVGIPRYR